MKLNPPAIPLITVDPYFSVWSFSSKINASQTVHWTGKVNGIVGKVIVDGKTYSFLGYHKNFKKMNQVSLSVSALTTDAVFECPEITVKASFTTPLLPDDYAVLSRPVSYMEFSYSSNDGKPHDVSFYVSADERLCLNEAFESPVTVEPVNISDDIKGIKMGNTVQKPLHTSGDDIRIDWGYFYLSAKGKDIDVGSDFTKEYGKEIKQVFISGKMEEGRSTLVTFAYDDIESIEYFGEHLKSYWNKDGKTIEEAILDATEDYASTMIRCHEFSSKLYSDAEAAGGEGYADLLSLAYRQVVAAHKLAVTKDGEILFVSKECFSNGCAATVDVSYPSIPLFLIYSPELVKGMMRPIYRYAASDIWAKKHKYDFAPHDVGQYPILNGQKYGYRDGDILELDFQMPVEECGNMLVMEAAVAKATGDTSFADSHMDVLLGWAEYLKKYGWDPENQLCTDDFAGHLAHNCNLSLKAIMGIAGLSLIFDMRGEKEKADEYLSLARDMAASWKERAANGDGSYKLAFDQPDTFSMKYNMVWDKIWGTELFGQELMSSETRENKKHFHEYGMPLDSRSDYTKSDWLVWTATMCDTKEEFEEFIAPLVKAYNDTETPVPLSDWYDTVSARAIEFRNRTVQGGLYMRLLSENK